MVTITGRCHRNPLTQPRVGESPRRPSPDLRVLGAASVTGGAGASGEQRRPAHQGEAHLRKADPRDIVEADGRLSHRALDQEGPTGRSLRALEERTLQAVPRPPPLPLHGHTKLEPCHKGCGTSQPSLTDLFKPASVKRQFSYYWKNLQTHGHVLRCVRPVYCNSQRGRTLSRLLGVGLALRKQHSPAGSSSSRLQG